MSADLATLQCNRCAGYFQVAAARGSRVRCPHCEWVASMGDFREVQACEVPALPQPTANPAGEAALWMEKGKHLQFGCPHCQRPMRMLRDEAGGLADCPHCGLEIVSPDPASGAGAKLSDASRRNLGAQADFNPRRVRGGGMRPPPMQVFEPAEPTAPTADEHPFDPFGTAAAAAEQSADKDQPPRPVRTLGVAQLGSAFKARDEVAEPPKISWDQDSAAANPTPESVPAESRGRLFTLAGAILLLLLAGMFVVLELRRRNFHADADTAAASPSPETPAVDPEHAAAFELARQVLAVDDWREMLPLVRSRQRVAATMAAYYAQYPLKRFEPVAFENPVRIDAQGTDYLQLRVTDAAGEGRLVGFECTADGEFLFDWEVWVDIARVEWEAFIAERPTTPRALRVTLARGSPLRRYAEDAGLQGEGVRGLRVWLDGSTAPLVAVLPASGEGGDEVWNETSWELGRRVVAELSFPESSTEHDRVVVHRVLQGRWLRP